MNFKIISDYNLINLVEWENFVKNHPNGNIFQTPDMYNVFKSNKFYEPLILICLDKDEEIVGLMLSVIQKEYRGILGKLSSRSIVYGGPLIKDNNTEIFDILFKEYNKIISRKAIYTQIRNLCDVEYFKEKFESIGYIFKNHLNILIDLTKSENTIWKEIYSRRRSQINKSEKHGVVIRIFDEVDLVDDSYNILKNVYKRAKLPLAKKEFFLSAYNILGKNGNLRFFGAFYQKKLIGVMYLLCYKERTYEWYIGSYNEYLKIHPNDLIIWEILKWSKNNGFKIFDFGGAGNPDKKYGVRDYKKKFGGEMINYGRYEKIHNRFLMSISIIGFRIWQFLKFGFRKN